MLNFIDVFLKRESKIPGHQEWYRVEESPMSGFELGELYLKGLTGCTVLALRRGDDITWAPESSMPVLDGDEIYLYGTNAQMALVERIFGFARVKTKRNHASGLRKIA